MRAGRAWVHPQAYMCVFDLEELHECPCNLLSPQGETADFFADPGGGLQAGLAAAGRRVNAQ